MTDTNPAIKCKKCEKQFEPDMNTKGAWLCPGCSTKNSNLKRHYRSVANLCILGLIITAISVSHWFSKTGQLTLGMLLSATHGVLLLVTIVSVYKSQTPWSDSVVKTLIWIVFSLALLSNAVLPFVLAGRLNIPAIIVYTIIFSYLFWLNSQASKCTAFEPAEIPTNENL